MWKKRRLALILATAALVPTGCRGREARQIAGAVEDFIDFGMSNEERPIEPTKEGPETPHLNERSRRVDHRARGGPLLDVEVDMPHKLGSKAVEAALSRELDRLMGETDCRQIRLRGRPAGLLKHGGLMGLATARLTAEERLVTKTKAMVRDSAPPLTDDQYKALVDLELALAAAPRGGAHKARAKIREIHGAKMVDSAIAAAQKRFGRR